MNRKTLTKKEVIKLLNSEMVWCKNNPTKQFSKDYQKGFINGLKQSVLLIKNYSIYE